MKHNQYFTVAATFDQLLRRLEEYAAARPPLSCKGIHFAVADPVDLFDPEWVRGQSATAHCYSRWETNEPLFLIAGPEGKAKCRVRMRALDPRIHDWLDALLDWLAPNWTTDDAQPLPEAPSLGPSAPPPPVLSQATAPVEKDAPRVPSRGADLRRWKATWKKIKPLVDEGASNDQIEAWFGGHDDYLRPSKDVLIDIIRAGEAGLLD